MPTLTCLCGLPGAGKTTRALEIARDTSAVYLGRDPLRESMLNAPDGWELTFLLFDMADSFLGWGYDVVVDACNLHPHDRERWERIGSSEPGRTLVWERVETPFEECVRRDAARRTPVGAERIAAILSECSSQ